MLMGHLRTWARMRGDCRADRTTTEWEGEIRTLSLPTHLRLDRDKDKGRVVRQVLAHRPLWLARSHRLLLLQVLVPLVLHQVRRALLRGTIILGGQVDALVLFFFIPSYFWAF